MKKLFIVHFLLLGLISNAQFKINNDIQENFTELDKQNFSWGYFIGVNYFSFKIHPVFENKTNPNSIGIKPDGTFNIYSDNNFGFSAGLLGKMRINDYLDLFLQPGIHFTERTLHFDNIEKGTEYNKPDPKNPYDSNISSGTLVGTDEHRTRDIKTTYLDIPLLLEIHGDRWFNTRPYIQGGFGYSTNLQSNEKSADDNEDGIFRMKSNNFNYQFETGINIYFKNFKLTPSIKGIFFINNELIADDISTPQIWSGALKSLKSRAVMFSLKFE